MGDSTPLIDPKELLPAAVGFLVGLAIMAVFVLIGLALGLSPSLQFGLPHQ